MKAFVLAILAAVAITVGSWYGLTHAGFSSADSGTSEANVRLD